MHRRPMNNTPTPVPLFRKHNWRVPTPTSECLTPLPNAHPKTDRWQRRQMARSWPEPATDLTPTKKGLVESSLEPPIQHDICWKRADQMQTRSRCQPEGGKGYKTSRHVTCDVWGVMWVSEWPASFSIWVLVFRWGDAGRSKENSGSRMWLWERDTTRVLQNKESVMCAAE